MKNKDHPGEGQGGEGWGPPPISMMEKKDSL